MTEPSSAHDPVEELVEEFAARYLAVVVSWGAYATLGRLVINP